MPSYRYTPEFPCIYTDRALEVNPGDVVEWDEAPADGRWEPVDPPNDDASTKTAENDDKTTDGEQADSTAEQPDAAAPPLDATEAAEAAASKKTTRRAAPAPKTEE